MDDAVDDTTTLGILGENGSAKSWEYEIIADHMNFLFFRCFGVQKRVPLLQDSVEYANMQEWMLPFFTSICRAI